MANAASRPSSPSAAAPIITVHIDLAGVVAVIKVQQVAKHHFRPSATHHNLNHVTAAIAPASKTPLDMVKKVQKSLAASSFDETKIESRNLGHAELGSIPMTVSSQPRQWPAPPQDLVEKIQQKKEDLSRHLAAFPGLLDQAWIDLATTSLWKAFNDLLSALKEQQNAIKDRKQQAPFSNAIAALRKCFGNTYAYLSGLSEVLHEDEHRTWTGYIQSPLDATSRLLIANFNQSILEVQNQIQTYIAPIKQFMKDPQCLDKFSSLDNAITNLIRLEFSHFANVIQPDARPTALERCQIAASFLERAQELLGNFMLFITQHGADLLRKHWSTPYQQTLEEWKPVLEKLLKACPMKQNEVTLANMRKWYCLLFHAYCRFTFRNDSTLLHHTLCQSIEFKIVENPSPKDTKDRPHIYHLLVFAEAQNVALRKAFTYGLASCFDFFEMPSLQQLEELCDQFYAYHKEPKTWWHDRAVVKLVSLEAAHATKLLGLSSPSYIIDIASSFSSFLEDSLDHQQLAHLRKSLQDKRIPDSQRAQIVLQIIRLQYNIMNYIKLNIIKAETIIEIVTQNYSDQDYRDGVSNILRQFIDKKSYEMRCIQQLLLKLESLIDPQLAKIRSQYRQQLLLEREQAAANLDELLKWDTSQQRKAAQAKTSVASKKPQASYSKPAWADVAPIQRSSSSLQELEFNLPLEAAQAEVPPDVVSHLVKLVSQVGKSLPNLPSIASTMYKSSIQNLLFCLAQLQELAKRDLSTDVILSQVALVGRGLEWILKIVHTSHCSDEELEAARDVMNSHVLTQIALTLIKDPKTPAKIKQTIGLNWPILSLFAQTNTCVNYPYTHGLDAKSIQLRDYLLQVAEVSDPSSHEILKQKHTQLITSGQNLMKALLNSYLNPSLEIVRLPALPAEELVIPPKYFREAPQQAAASQAAYESQAAAAEAPATTALRRITSPDDVQAALVEIINWSNVLMQSTPLGEQDGEAEARTIFMQEALRHVILYAKRLQQRVSLKPEDFFLAASLSSELVHRLVKESLAAALFYNQGCYNERQEHFMIENRFQNNPFVLAKKLQEVLPNSALPLPPYGLYDVHIAASNPYPTPMTPSSVSPATHQWFQKMAGFHNERSVLQKNQAATVIIKGREVTYEGHQRHVATIINTINDQSIYPGLSYVLKVLESAFPMVEFEQE